ncbi:MAG: oligopeptide/dipeptide ABC transporter ATP-binding protein [Halorhabdus sp.]
MIRSIPEIEGERTKLQPVQGQVPDLMDMPNECYYADRCDYAHDACFDGRPRIYYLDDSPTHQSRCVLHDQENPRTLSELAAQETTGNDERGVSDD